ncbi:MAG: hypothetical protein R3F07_06960 [Opitutaceae bacterium]
MSDPSAQEVLRALDLLLDSPDFARSERSRRFLDFVVRARLEGREFEISQNTLATEVFDRQGSFDPSTDPIVRMQAGRVRRSLEHYYLTHRDQHLVKIVLPKGTYVPEFLSNDETREIEPESGSRNMTFGNILSDHQAPVIVVCPFANLTGDPELDYLARGLSMHIAIGADQRRDVRVLVSSTDPISATTTTSGPLPENLSVGLCLRGALLRNGTVLSLDVQLIECETGYQIWARQFVHSQPEVEIAAFLEHAARQVALMMFNEGGILYRHQIRQLPSEHNTDPDSYEAILRYFDWQLAPDPEAFGRVIHGLQVAVRKDPRSGIARSFLARCYADLWALGFDGIPVRIEEALDLALEGLSRNPQDCRTEAIAGYVCLVMDDMKSARRHAEAALVNAGGSLLFLDAISYLLTLCGDWERGSAKLRQAIQGNPFHSRFVHGALWAEALRRDDFALALSEAMATTTSSSFWCPLMQCVALAHLGRIDDAVRFRERILEFRPGFSGNADWLIRRYIKDDALVAQIKEGLAIAGLTVS